MQEFRDRVAVVTGGASGIGRAMAERFAAAGMRAGARRRRGGGAGDDGRRVAASGADRARRTRRRVASPPTSTPCATVPSRRSARCTSCATTPGVGGGGIVDAPLELWDWVLGVNLFGVVHGVHTFLPLLLEQDEGHIVNTASLAGLGGVGGLGVYCTSKFAVVGLSESLHYDLAARGARSASRCCARVSCRRGSANRRGTRRLRCRRGRRRKTRRRRGEMANALAAAGIPPAVVADAVFDAIVDARSSSCRTSTRRVRHDPGPTGVDAGR